MPTFSLALGKKIPRKSILRNRAQPVAFRNYAPEIAFYIWCTWRLDSSRSVVASSDGGEIEITRGLKRIIGKDLQRITITPPAWDIALHFEPDLRLTAFCDHAGKNPSFEGNWEACVRGRHVFVGPGTKLVTSACPEDAGSSIKR